MNAQDYDLSVLFHVRDRKREFIRVYGRERGLDEFETQSRFATNDLAQASRARKSLREALEFGKAHGRTSGDFGHYLRGRVRAAFSSRVSA